MMGKIKDFYFHGAYNLFICKKAYWELPGSPDDTTLTVEIEEELRSLLMKVKEESEKNSTFKMLRSWYPVPSLHGK